MCDCSTLVSHYVEEEQEEADYPTMDGHTDLASV